MSVLTFFRPALPVLLGGVLALAAGGAAALEPDLPLSALHHDMWTARDGMPGDVWDMTQDRDGFIWFAATSGLYRFDGAHFEQVRAFGGTALRSNVLSVVHAFPNGDLWIGYRYAGIGVVRNGVLQHFGEADGYVPGMLRAIERDGQGRIWAVASPRVLMYDGTRWQHVGAERGLPAATSILGADCAGRIWVETPDGPYRQVAGQDRFVRTPFGSDFAKVIDDPAGATWLYAQDRLQRLPPEADPPPPAAGAPLPYAWDAVFDGDGNLWDANCDDLVRLTPADLAHRTTVWRCRAAAERIPGRRLSGSPMIAMVDREGGIWTATRNGVDRFRRNRVVPLALPGTASYIGLAGDADGSLWIQNRNGNDVHLWQHTGKVLRRAPERDVQLIGTAADGALLLARAGHFERRGKGARRRIAYPAALAASRVVVMLDDGRSLWAGFVPGGLQRHADGRWRPATAFGLDADAPISMGRDGAGAVWLGYRDNRVAVFTPATGAVRRYGSADGLAVGAVGHVADAGGAHLVAGDMGLALLAGGRFVPVRATDPQVLDGVTGILATPAGDVWLNGRKGLVRIPAAAWRAWRADPRGTIADWERFDDADGYPGIAQFGVRQASLLQDRSGRIWVAGSTGAAVLDPQRLPHNPLAPPIHIESVGAAGRTLAAGATAAPIVLPAGTRDLQLAYTAPSFTMPERVRFRYRLDGVDADGAWQDAGTRRTAYYNNLGPGRYRFEVTAANEDGVWNPQPAALDVTIPPTFVESPAFKALCGLALLGAAWLLLRWRLLRVTRRLRALLQARAGERERIARTLHDTLMQSVQALLMLFERARDHLPAGSAALPLLDHTLGQARATLSEGRDELSALRGAAAPERDLVGALAPLGEILGAQFGVRFTVHASGTARALRRDVAVEACFIAREALQNAFRHARAAAVALDIDFGAAAFVLRVRDDGRGLAPDAVRPGHWGLAGMRERAAAIGAELAIGPGADGTGTTVALRLAAAQAYDAAPRRRWWQRRSGAAPVDAAQS